MQLSKKALGSLDGARIDKPSGNVFGLPEKVIQFGTGVLLRGLCDYFINKANRQQVFNGRIVVVKSTDAGGTDAFATQNNLYTICSRGIDNGNLVKENVICASIGRVLSAKSQWQEVLALAENPSLEIIISNTTEVGLQLVEESIHQSPPSSYPAKLLALLYRRFRHFKGDKNHGFVVIPTELITENGTKLKEIVEKLAAVNQLEKNFLEWMSASVHFCNSLVDRIVTKDPGEDILNNLQQEIGYEDELLTMCEDYRLWAIQGNAHVASVLGFTDADAGVFVKPDIEIYKSLKLHLLNGTHTFSACLAFLSGFETVKEAMDDPEFYAFVRSLMLEEIGSAMPGNISSKDVDQFGTKVLDRFQNPFLRHLWLNITFQCTAKMKMRNVGVLKRYHELHETAPRRMATGFAAYILFMRAVKLEGKVYYGSLNGNFYPINDEHAGFFYELWQRESQPQQIVKEVLANQRLWETDLNALAPFAEAVTKVFAGMLENGVQFKKLKASTDISQ
jgi:tagaturonate reductase